MAVGFRTRNAGGGIQIDQTFRNLALRAKGTLVPGTSWNAGKWRLGTITVTGNSPVLAWRSASPAATVQATRIGTSITYTFIVAATGGSIDWYLFDEPVYGAAAGTLGMRIRNPTTGVVVFDSRMKYMRIVGTINGDFSQTVPPAAGTTTRCPRLSARRGTRDRSSWSPSRSKRLPPPETGLAYLPRNAHCVDHP